MPRMRVTDLGRQRMYLTRHMYADDGTAEIEPNVIEAARALGYVEDIEPEPERQRSSTRAARKVSSRRAKSAALEEKTVPELREMAEEQGVELPSGYVKKDELVDLIEDAGGEDDDSGRF